MGPGQGRRVRGGTPAEPVVFFSEFFRLGRTQEQLDFVDVPLNTDIPLYVDPYAFKIGADLWSVECNNLVVDFFQNVVECIRVDDHARMKFLLGNLHEPNTTHLGLSSGRPSGRGIGGEQATSLYLKLKDSRAARSGILKDLSDCELMIPGIGHDKISDITINIIRHKLAWFTELQCQLYQVPAKHVPLGAYWCSDDATWKGGYGKLPVYGGRPVILVPKRSVRHKPAADHQEYYSDFVLEFLQQENLNSNSSLVQVLKGGKRRVTKRSLEELLPCSKEFLFEFSQKHPEVLQRYKQFLPTKNPAATDEEIRLTFEKVFGRSPGSVTINQHVNVTAGEMNMQKNVVQGDNIGGVVGSGTVNARDVTLFKNHVDRSGTLRPDERKALLEARARLEDAGLPLADMHDVADSLGKLTVELEKPAKEAGLIKRYFTRIQEVAPAVASILAGIETVKELVEGLTS